MSVRCTREEPIVSPSSVDEIELSDLDWWARPQAERDEAFARLRAERPVARMVLPELPYPEVPELGVPETEYWAVTRHADLVEVSRQAELFCSGKGTNI